jgi:hypothetical protein
MASDRDKQVGRRVTNAERNENTGTSAERQAAISGRGNGKAVIRRGGTVRSQRELGHVRDK